MHDRLLVGFLLLNAVGAPTSRGALHVHASWAMPALLDALSEATSIPISQVGATAEDGRGDCLLLADLSFRLWPTATACCLCLCVSPVCHSMVRCP